MIVGRLLVFIIDGRRLPAEPAEDDEPITHIFDKPANSVRVEVWRGDRKTGGADYSRPYIKGDALNVRVHQVEGGA